MLFMLLVDMITFSFAGLYGDSGFCVAAGCGERLFVLVITCWFVMGVFWVAVLWMFGYLPCGLALYCG